MTDREDEWGPWVEHNGEGCPVPLGVFVHAVAIDAYGGFQEDMGQIMSFADRARAWDWSFYRKVSPFGYRYSKIIRYRIRKPRGMAILEALLQDLPQTAPGKEDVKG